MAGYNGLGGDVFMNSIGMNPADQERRRKEQELAKQQQLAQLQQGAVTQAPPQSPSFDAGAARAASDAKSAALDEQQAGLFNTYRQRAQQQGGVAKQTQGEALKRRFAQIGNLNSGAYIKAAGLQDEAADKTTNQAVQDVDLQETQAKVAGNEAEKNRLVQREQFDKQFGLQLDQFKQSQLNDRLNALTAVQSLSDEALKSQSGIQDFGGGILGTGDNLGKSVAIQKILKSYGY